MKMKKLTAILMLLCAALFAMPAGAMAETRAAWVSKGDLALNGAADPDGDNKYSFPNAKLTDITDVNYMVVTGSKMSTPNTWEPIFKDSFFTTVNGTEVETENGFRVYKIDDITLENGVSKLDFILEFIRNIEFVEHKYARIEFLESNPGRMYFNPDNRHYYRYVHDTAQVTSGNTTSVNGPTWREALSSAANDYRLGRKGYLANITSSSENAFVVNMLNVEDDKIPSENHNEILKSAWLGGTRWKRATDGSDEITNDPGESWYWVDGPEKNTEFYSGKIYDPDKQDSTTAGDEQSGGEFVYWNNQALFTDADASEPNNSAYTAADPEKEFVLMLYHQDTTSTVKDDRWNDLPGTANTTVTGYLVEYGNRADGGTGDTTGDSDETQYILTLHTNLTEECYATGYTPPSVIRHGQGVSLPNEDEIKHSVYTFKGWYSDASLAGDYGPKTIVRSGEANQNREYWAKWTAPVELHLNGGSCTENIEDLTYTVTVGASLPAENTMSCTGYDFKGWYTNAGFTGDPVTSVSGEAEGPKNFYAKWTPIPYTITLDAKTGTIANDGLLGFAPKTETTGNTDDYFKTYTVEDAVTLPVPDKAGYTFDGWFSEEAFTDASKVESITAGTTGNKTLYAKYSANNASYTVCHHYQKAPNSEEYEILESEVKPGKTDAVVQRDTVAKTGVTGFVLNTTKTAASQTIPATGMLTYDVYYDREQYSITYYTMNCETANPSPTSYIYGETVELQNCTGKPGYVFDGWYENANYDGDKVTGFDDSTHGDKEYYAKWNQTVTVTVEWNDNGNQQSLRPTTSDNATVSLTTSSNISSLCDPSALTQPLTEDTTSLAFAVPAHMTASKTGETEKITYTIKTKDDDSSRYVGGTWAMQAAYSESVDGLTLKLASSNATRNINGTITWVDGSNTYGLRPAQVTVVLTDGKAGNDKTSYLFDKNDDDNGDNAWQYQIDNLLVYGQGMKYVYETSMENFGNYVVTKNGNDFTAKLTKAALEAKVIWCDKDGNPVGSTVEPIKPNAPFDNQTVELMLKQNGAEMVATKKTANGENSYIVSFGNQDLWDSSDALFEYTLGYTSLPAGYTLNGAPTRSGSTLTIQLKPETYDVALNENGGGDLGDQKHTYGTETTLPTPTRSGYTFEGWTYTENGEEKTLPEKVKIPAGTYGNQEYTAKWTKNAYSITYHYGEGVNSADVANENPGGYDVEDADITLVDAVRTGYDFRGWFEGNDTDCDYLTLCTSIDTARAEDIHLYAMWQNATYKVTLDADGGTLPEGSSANDEYTFGTEKTLPTPEKAGYTFEGWTYTENGEEKTLPNKVEIPEGTHGDKSYKAKYAPIRYTITYVLNGGTNDPANPTEYTIETTAFTLLNPTKAGCSFDGWFAKYDSTKPEDDQYTEKMTTVAGGMHDNITLYAKWTEGQYRLLFVTYGKPIVPVSYGYYDDTQTIDLTTIIPVSADDPSSDSADPKPLHPEWVFKGWYENPDYTGSVVTSFDKKTFDTAQDKTFYARWQIDLKDVSLTWDDRNNQDGRRGVVDMVLKRMYTENGQSQIAYDNAKKLTLTPEMDSVTDENGIFTNLDAHIGGNEMKYDLYVDLITPQLHRPGLYEEKREDAQKPYAIKLYHGPEMQVYTVKVIWHDAGNKYGDRPSSLEVELYAKNAKPEEIEEPPIQERIQTLTSAGGWEFTWTKAQVNATPTRVKPLEYDVQILSGIPSIYTVTKSVFNDETKVQTIEISHLKTMVPDTGDKSSIALWGGLLALCAGGLGLLAAKRRKSRA